MNDAVLVVFALATVAYGVLLVTMVRPDRVRSVALLSAVSAALIFGQNNAPTSIRTAALVAAASLVLLAEMRSSRRARGSRIALVSSGLWWVLVGAVASIADSYSMTRWATQVLFVLVIGWSVSRCTPDDLRRFLNGLIVVLAAQTVLAVLEVWGPIEPLWGYRFGLRRENPFLPSFTRAQATFGHPLVYGFAAGLGLVLAGANPGGLRARWRVPLLALLAGGVLLSGTRSAALSAAIGLAVFALTATRVLTWLRAAALVTIIAGVVLLLDFGLADFVSDTIDSGSFVHRSESIDAISALLHRSGWQWWWGSGYGSETTLFRDGYIRLTFGLPVVDNFFVYVLGTMGVVGLAVTVALLVMTFVRGQRYVRALVVYCTAMFFSFDVTVWLSSGLLLFLVVALSGALSGGGIRPRSGGTLMGVDDFRGGTAQPPRTPRERVSSPATVAG